jgi:hypothetical protein
MKGIDIAKRANENEGTHDDELRRNLNAVVAS